MQNAKPTICFVVFLAIMSVAAAKDVPNGGRTFLGFYLMLHAKFIFTQEEIVPTGKGTRTGLYGAQIQIPPAGLSTQQTVKFMRNQLPEIRIWRGSRNLHVIHFADRQALKWKGNPLNRRLTFHGTMSIVNLESHVFAKAFPGVRFYNFGSGGSGGGSGGISLPRHPKLFTAPMHFNAKGISLRRFLTTAIHYRVGPKRAGQQLWQAQLYQGRNGKFTGRVDIFITADPIVPPSTRKQRAEGK